DGIRYRIVTGVQTCALPIYLKLTLWAWPGFGLQDLVDQYEDENPGISIEIQEADYADVHENLITALASGSGAPDISAVDEGYLEIGRASCRDRGSIGARDGA